MTEASTSKTAPPTGDANGSTIDSGSWTSLRMVILAEGAPQLLRLDVQVDQQDLETGFDAAVRQGAELLGIDGKPAVAWEELLDHPLVASGWLGNLVATAEQRSQLIAMYDSQRDQRVQMEEFQAFMTRGLSRQPRLRLVAAQPEPALMQLESPWGPIDQDQDGALSRTEIEQAASVLMRLDYDGDRILTVGEFRGTSEAADPMTMVNRRARLLELRSVMLWDPAQPDALSRALLERYSFTENVPRQEFRGWTDQRFQLLDHDQDGELSRKELGSLSDQSLDLLIRAQYPNSVGCSGELESARLQVRLLDAAENRTDESSGNHPGTVTSRPTSDTARVALAGCVLTVRQVDDYSFANRRKVTEYFQRALRDKQLEGTIANALDLKAGAFDLLDQPSSSATIEQSPEPEKGAMAADARAARAWGWLVGPRQWQLQVSWSLSNSPWFELLDQNGDRRLSQAEFESFQHWAGSLDYDGDGQLSAAELPMSILLEIGRVDSRGFSSQLGGTSQEKRGAIDIGAPTWFTAMDYNSDGELSRSEFLGDESDFEQLDSNRDGVIQARELKAP